MKAHRVGERRYGRNRPVRTALRTFVKKARSGIAVVASGAGDEAAALVAQAAKELDQAASKGIIHKNQAARRKSRLMHQLAVAAKSASTPAETAAETAPRTTRRRGGATQTTTSAPRTRSTRAAGESAEKAPPRPRRGRQTS